MSSASLLLSWKLSHNRPRVSNSIAYPLILSTFFGSMIGGVEHSLLINIYLSTILLDKIVTFAGLDSNVKNKLAAAIMYL